MVNLLTKLFVKDRDNTQDPAVRRAFGSLSSVVGILLNVLLFAIKLIAGTLTGSLSIRADAVNNLSDAGSSVVSLVSFKISAKPADREHPFGHARIEYVASMIVSFLILMIGVDMVKDAIAKLRAPAVPQFSVAAVVILSVSVLLKLWLSYFNRTLGRKIDSEVMRATSADALSDAIATSAVLITTLVAPLLPERIGMYIDPVMGLIVATLIFVAGARILNDTKNSILGTKPDEETVKTICEVVERFPEAIGIHDMMVHNYGPCRTLATLHVEVDGKKDIFASHDAIDNIERVLREEYGIECSIHLDPIVVDDPLVEEWRDRTQQLAHVIDERIMLHDFRVVPGTSHTNLLFDMAVPFEIKESDEELKKKMAMAVAAVSPNFYTVITVDRV